MPQAKWLMEKIDPAHRDDIVVHPPPPLDQVFNALAPLLKC